MSKANAKIEITASTSKLAAGLQTAYREFKSFGGAVARTIGGAFKSINSKLEIGKTAKTAIGNFGGDLMGRGMDAVIDTAREVRNFESDMQRLATTTHKTPAEMAALRSSLMDVSNATAISREELLAASGVYYDLTSDAEGMAKSIGSLARVSQASGAGMEELVKTSAALKDSMGIGAGEMEAIFSGLISQGEAGKVTLKELASNAPSLMAMFSKFNTGAEGVFQMNAAFQVGAKAFGSASQAATGLEAMMGMLQARQKQLKAAGVDVFRVNKDGTVTLRNLQDIIADISKKNIDPRKWGKVFGENKEGRNFLETLMKYPQLYQEIVDAGSNAGLVQEYALARAEHPAGRLDKALNNLKLTIAEAFTPERIEAFIATVERLAQKLGPVVEGVGWMADKLGSIANVGRSIRGFFEGDGNRFREQAMNAQMSIIGARSTDEALSRAGLAERLNVNADGFDRAKRSILGAEVGEKTSEASIRAAYLFTREQGGGEAVGAGFAGSSYLREAGWSIEKAGALWAKPITDVLEANLKNINDAIARTPKVQVGNEQVARAAGKSTSPRTGVQ